MARTNISDVAFVGIIITIVVELLLGVLAATWTAVKIDGVETKLVLFVELLFASLIFCFTVTQIKYRMREKLCPKSCVWICGLCTCGTIAVLTTIYGCNLDEPEAEDTKRSVKGLLFIVVAVWVMFGAKFVFLLYVELTSDEVAAVTSQSSNVGEVDPSNQYEYLEPL